MNKTMADETIILSALNSRWIKNKVVNDLLITKAADRYKGSNNNYDQRLGLELPVTI